MAHATSTIDHVEIKEWVEEHGGSPAVVEGTYDGFGSGILRVDWGVQDEAVEQLSWEEFFRVFDDNDLAFVYQSDEGEGESYSCRFVARSAEGIEDTGGSDNDLYSDSSSTDVSDPL